MAEAGRGDPGFRARVAEALDRIRPALRLDGGDIELLGVAGRDATVRLVVSCVG